MPIDIQCPDCEHVFGVPSSMAGKRTLCRGCNAALIVPEEEPDEIPLERAPDRPSRRTAPVGEKPPNWDTPIPFRSPGPIVGVLLIALLASTIILVGYGLARTPTAATKLQPNTAGPQPTEPTYPEPKAADPKASFEREVILPDRELIVAKAGRGDSTRHGGLFVPKNWLVVHRGDGYAILDRARGGTIGSVSDSRSRIVERTVTASPSGRWLAAITQNGTTLELFQSAYPDQRVRAWKPYDSLGRLCSACAILSDERLLTISANGNCDLWAIPSGDYIRRVARLDNDGSNADVSFEKMLFAVRNGSKLEIYSLEDDEFGAAGKFAMIQKPFDPILFQCRFTPDGKRLVAMGNVRVNDELFDERVEVFDVAGRKRIAEWTLPLNRRSTDAYDWCLSNESLLVHRHLPGSASGYRLTDGKLESTIDCPVPIESVMLDGAGQRVLFADAERSPARLYGFDLPLRTPANLQKNPVWEYKGGVLELKKAAR